MPLLKCFLLRSFIIRNTLHRLGLDSAKMNVPINITSIPVHKLKQPPWIVW